MFHLVYRQRYYSLLLSWHQGNNIYHDPNNLQTYKYKYRVKQPTNIQIQIQGQTIYKCTNLSSSQVFSEVRVTASLILCVSFPHRCLSFCPFCFGHCDVCSSSVYEWWLPLWYLQTLLRHEICVSVCRYILIWQFCNSAIQYYKL